jgi:arylsulfatase A-like enzyme
MRSKNVCVLRKSPIELVLKSALGDLGVKLKGILFTLLTILFIANTISAQRPNFILILTDDQGWTSTSQLMDDNIPNSKSDYFETPMLEKLAERGMRFTNGYAPSALCCPTRRSIQFGQTPMRQGDDEEFKEKYFGEKRSQISIPELLKSIDPNYKTAHYGKWDLRTDIFPEDLGYDESDGNTGNKNGDMNSTKETKWTDYFLNNDPKRIETITARAINFMNRNTKSGNPFYLQVSHYATHVDMQTTEELYNKYLKKRKGGIHSNPAWAGMLESLDTGIGKILDMIDELGIADNTYLIVMADNGGAEFIPPVKNKFDHPTSFKNHPRNYPLRGGKWTLYEGGVRVPFMVIGPGIKAGSQCDIPIVGWDILPTISDLAGNKNPLPQNLDGVSFQAALDNGNQGDIKRKNDELVFHYFGKSHSAIRVGDYKLIKFWNLKKTELYNLTHDLGELDDLSKKYPQKVQEMENELMKYIKEVNAESYITGVSPEKAERDDD